MGNQRGVVSHGRGGVVSMTFDDMLNFYANYRKSSDFKDVIPKTLYRFYFISAEHFGDITSLRQEMVDDWLRQKSTESKNSYHARVYPIISFLKFVKEKKWSDITIPKIPKNPPNNAAPHIFTKDELCRFFKACDEQQASDNSLPKKLNKLAVPVFFRLLYGTGMRPNEGRCLAAEGVDLRNGIITIHESKGYRERRIPVHHSLLEILCRYDSAVSMLLPDRRVFFPAFGDKVYSHKWVGDNFHRLWYKYNTTRAVAYDFRHNFAISNINSWINVESDIHTLMVALSKYMGHRTFASTMYYYSIVPKLADIIENQSEESFNNIVPNISDYEEE